MEMDDVYDLPYMRTYHPSYEKQGGVPAIAEIKFSLISNRGCFGGCSFCALTFHQGQDYTDQKPRIHYRRGKTDDGGSGVSRGISMMWAVPQPTSGSRPVTSS